MQNSTQNKKLDELMVHKDILIEQTTQQYKSQVEKQQPKPFNYVSPEMIQERDMSICIRSRPLLQHEIDAGYFYNVFTSNPSFFHCEPKLNIKLQPEIKTKEYKVNYAFGPQDTNETVNGEIVTPLVDCALDLGFSSVFCYGQTGSGKTYTMQGLQMKLAQDLFQRQKETQKISLFVAFCELIGNTCTDLLNGGKEVMIAEDKYQKVQINGAVAKEVKSAEEYLELNAYAVSQRKTVCTYKNDTSSRSHAICKIVVRDENRKSDEDGSLMLIDLAGSENAGDSQFHDKELLAQTKEINKSLMTLKDCMSKRSEYSLNPNKRVHVPYRGNKLTLLLKEAFELGTHFQCKTVIIANVSPSTVDLSMTKNTLKFIESLKVIMRDKPRTDLLEYNPKNPGTWKNEHLREWAAKRLKPFDVDVEIFCPFESGKQILNMHQEKFKERVKESCRKPIGKIQLDHVYTELWGMLIDARRQLQNGNKTIEKSKAVVREWDTEQQKENDRLAKK